VSIIAMCCQQSTYDHHLLITRNVQLCAHHDN